MVTDPPVMTSGSEPVTQSTFAEAEAHALMANKRDGAPEATSDITPGGKPDAKAS